MIESKIKELAEDFALFHNISVKQAYNTLMSVIIKGDQEILKRYSVHLSEAILELKELGVFLDENKLEYKKDDIRNKLKKIRR